MALKVDFMRAVKRLDAICGHKDLSPIEKRNIQAIGRKGRTSVSHREGSFIDLTYDRLVPGGNLPPCINRENSKLASGGPGGRVAKPQLEYAPVKAELIEDEPMTDAGVGGTIPQADIKAGGEVVGKAGGGKSTDTSRRKKRDKSS